MESNAKRDEVSGQESVASDQKPFLPTPSPLGSFSLSNRGLQAESNGKRDRPPFNPFRRGGTPRSGGNRHSPGKRNSNPAVRGQGSVLPPSAWLYEIHAVPPLGKATVYTQIELTLG